VTKSPVGLDVGREVGEDDDGALDGTGVGRDVGTLDGFASGALDGLDDEGCEVGLFVSPGLVGLDVAGASVGIDVGELLVGIDVGAETNIGSPTTTATSLIELIDDFAFDVRKTPTSPLIAERIRDLENEPDSTEIVIMSVKWLVSEIGSGKSARPARLLVIEKLIETFCIGAVVGLASGLESPLVEPPLSRTACLSHRALIAVTLSRLGQMEALNHHRRWKLIYY